MNMEENYLIKKFNAKKRFNIESEKHDLHTNEINEIALSQEDDKRYIMKENISILKQIKEE